MSQVAAVIADLLRLADAGPPNARALEARLHGAPLPGVVVRDDARGWGAYVDIDTGTYPVGDIIAIVGPMTPMPRNPDDFHSGAKLAAYVARGGKTVRVFVELDRQDERIARRVTLHFQT